MVLVGTVESSPSRLLPHLRGSEVGTVSLLLWPGTRVVYRCVVGSAQAVALGRERAVQCSYRRHAVVLASRVQAGSSPPWGT